LDTAAESLPKLQLPVVRIMKTTPWQSLAVGLLLSHRLVMAQDEQEPLQYAEACPDYTSYSSHPQ
jgi:hypothetical protein